MTTRHLKILNLVSDPNTVEVIYNTNGTFLLDQPTVNLLKKFKNVQFILSIDGYGKLNDQVRTGSKWAVILRFIDQMVETKFKFSVHSVLHLNNCYGIVDLSNFVKTLNVEWTVNVLTYPKHLDIVNATNKQDLELLINSADVPNKEYILKHLHEDINT